MRFGAVSGVWCNDALVPLRSGISEGGKADIKNPP